MGPNGSGKSNVVDALAWVMGEQGAKTLRGGQMADVIFAGTSGRSPLGRAQVDLTIDNTDGALPIDYSEVTISRTLFRGGGSEYSINGAPARLLDVQELLSDTGMGRQMHVIVGQGQLDAILSSTPEERRGFIEEAAGVLKHRRRKERALRKLSDMDANLVRVLDLTNELHRQLKPLARQAKVARKATLIQARVHDAKARIIADDVVRVRERLRAQGENDEALQRRRLALEEEMTQLKKTIARLEDEKRSHVPEVETLTNVWREATTVHERLRATLLAAQDRYTYLSRPLPPPQGEDPEELERQAQEAAAEDTHLIEETDAAQTALNEAIQAKVSAEEADTQASSELAQVNRVLADHREHVARRTGDVGSARSRLEAAEAEAQRADSFVAEAEERLQQARNELNESTGSEDDTDPADVQDTSSETAAGRHAAAVAARDAAREHVDTLLARERDAQAERARWEARRDTLAESLTPEDSTASLATKKSFIADFPSLVHVDEGWEDALAALLAPFADAAVIDSLPSALDHVRAARTEGSGQVRMLLPSSSDASNRSSGTDSPPLPESTYWARDLVTADHRVEATVNELLVGAVICSDFKDIPHLLTRSDILIVATESGDIFTRHSAIGAGQAPSSVLTLHAHYDRAVTASEEAREREERARSELDEATVALDRAVKTANKALQALREEDAERAKVSELRARLTSVAHAAGAEAERARASAATATEHLTWAREQLAEAEARLEESRKDAPEENLSDAQQQADAAALTAREAREKETSARLALRAVEERSRLAQSKAQSLRQHAAREREERQRYESREERRHLQRDMVARVVELTKRAVATSQHVLDDIEGKRQEAEAQRLHATEETDSARQQLDAATEELADVTGERHRDEVAKAEMMLRLEQIMERSLTELGLEEDALVAEYGPHTLVPILPTELPDETGAGEPVEEDDMKTVPYVRAEQEAALEAALKDLEKLGRVNPLALEEYDALAARHEFLVTQVNDLKKSKADILHIIEDVDALVEEAFTQAFEETNVQFSHTFEVLFPGGEGRLVLTEPEDMLTTGIEIEARPAGKKVKRLSLLSGGERSLAALAFLVSIFKARPSPFYVMDEVEAALDEVNLSRLLTIFGELRESSQLIVITHQKRTMEIADALYGVTMRDGVTRVVSSRLSE